MSDPASTLAPLWSLCLTSTSSVRPGTLWSAWSFAPVVTIPLLAFGVLYLTGALQPTRPPKAAFSTAAAVAAWALLAVALVSPLCRLSATLAWAHMAQHLILVAAAPPLIILAAPVHTVRAGLRRLTSSAVRPDVAVDRPLLATGLYGLLIWLWHIPATYEHALTDASWHAVYLASLLGASLWFWSCIIRAKSPGVAAIALLVTMVHTGLLGALLTFASGPLYPQMASGAIAFGLSPIEDQQLAGVIMWVPMGMIYLLSALLVIGRGLLAEQAGPAL